MNLFEVFFGRRQTPAPAPIPTPRPLPELAAEEPERTVTLASPGTTTMRHIIAPVHKDLFEQICGRAAASAKRPEDVVLELLNKALETRPAESGEKVNVVMSNRSRERLMDSAQQCGYRSHVDFARGIIMTAYEDVAQGKAVFRLSSRGYMRSSARTLIIDDFPAEFLEQLHQLASAQHSSMRRVASSLFKIGFDNFFRSGQ